MGDKLQNKILAEQIVGKAMQEVAFKYNAYAPIVSSLRIAYTDQIKTMGVDKYARLVINPDFLVENKVYATGLLIHETLHIFFGHTTDIRSKLAYTEDAHHNRIANMAEDCAINQFINEPLPKGVVTPDTLGIQIGVQLDCHESAEYYYDKIMESLSEQKENGEGGGEASSLSSLSSPACSTDEANTQAMQDLLDKMGVEHLSQEEINDKVMDTAIELCKSRGSQYGALADFAREMLEPKVDWRPLLQGAIRNAEKKVWTLRSRQTYKRTSRRSGQFLMPKKYGHKVSVTLSFDTSGSITQEMVNQFLSEVQNCLRYSEIKECALWHTNVYWYGTPEELIKNVEKVFETGGTDSRCVEECAEHCKADIHFTFTDGEWGPDPKRTPKCKVGTLYSIRWNGKEITEIRKEF